MEGIIKKDGVMDSEAGSKRKFGLTGAALKYIALVSMTIDHIGAVILERLLIYRGPLREAGNILLASGIGEYLYRLDYFFRLVGRIAFPVYCLLLVEGFCHTRNRRRYGLAMVIFALVSEIPYSLAVWNTWFGETHNVYIELALGLLVLWGIEKCSRLESSARFYGIAGWIAGGAAASMVLQADYSIDGIFLISLIYLLRGRKKEQALLSGLLIFFTCWEWFSAAGALAAGCGTAFFLFLYNGEKGRRRGRYGFYWFYPLHLLALFALRLWFLGIPLE